MNTSVLSSKNRISLPAEVVAAAHLRLNDEIYWSVDKMGELHGRKLEAQSQRPGRIVPDPESGLLYWLGDISDEEAETAALSANLTRHD